MNNKIKHYFFEIIMAILTVLLTAGLFVLKAYRNSGYIYEGEYVYSGGNETIILNVDYDKNSELLEMDLEYIDTYGVTSGSIYFSEILEYDDYDYSFFTIENMTVPPDGMDRYAQVKDDVLAGMDLTVSFSGKSVIISAYTSNSVMRYYLYKNGALNLITIEIIQNIFLAAIALILTVYAAVQLKKHRTLRLMITAGISVVWGILTSFLVCSDIFGEYRDESDETIVIINEVVNDENEGVIWREIDTKYSYVGCERYFKKSDGDLVCSTDYVDYTLKLTSNGVRLITSGGNEIEYHNVSDIAFNGKYSLLYIIPFLFSGITAAFSARHSVDKRKSVADVPYGIYKVGEPLYLCDAMKGLKGYFEENIAGETIELSEDSCRFFEEKISNPTYNLSKMTDNEFPIQMKSRSKKITIMSDKGTKSRCEIIFDKKNMVLVQKMEDMVTVIYKLDTQYRNRK